MRDIIKKEVVVVLLCHDHTSYLLQLRDFSPAIDYPGQWGAFGGGIEKGETSESAVYRELTEELQYVPKSIHKIKTYTMDHLVSHNFYCDLETSLVNLKLAEGLDMGLFTKEEIFSRQLYSKKLKKHFPVAQLLIQYFEDFFNLRNATKSVF